MAKEKKKKIKVRNMKLEQNELQATTIGMFENRKKSSVGVVILVMFFVLFVFYLPEITDKVQEYLIPNTPVVKPNNPSKPSVTPNPGDEGDNYDDVVYPLTPELKIERDDIIVSNFILNVENKTLDFTITNNSKNAQKMEELNYYLELYNADQTLLERIKITGDTTLISGSFSSLKKSVNELSATTLTSFSLVKKKISDYPVFNLNADGDGFGVIVCKNNHEQVTYRFNDNALKGMVSEVSYAPTDLDYESILPDYKGKSLVYNNKDGVVSMFQDYEGVGFKATTDVDLSRTERLYVYNADSFNLDTAPNVVKFEMEAQGFLCE